MVKAPLDLAPTVPTMQARSPREGKGDLLPLTPEFLEPLQQQNVVLRCPRCSVDKRIQSLSPSLGTLVVCSSWDTLSDLAPLALERLDASFEEMILFLCPWALLELWVQRMEPAFPAVLVGPPWHACSDLGPLFRLVAIYLNGGAELLVLLGGPDNSFSSISLPGRCRVIHVQQFLQL